MTKTAWVLALIFACFSKAGGQDNDLNVELIPDSLLHNAHTVIRANDRQIVVKSLDKVVFRYKVVATVLNSKGDYHLKFYKGYKEGTSKISKIDIKFFDKDGKLIYKVPKKKIEDYAAYDGYSIISDSRIKYYDYRPSEYPITVSYSYELSSKNSLIGNWYPAIGFGTSVQEASLSIKNQTSVPLRHKIVGDNIAEAIQEEHITFSYKNQKAVKNENYSNGYWSSLSHVMLGLEKFRFEGHTGTISDWEAYGKWVNDAFLNQDNLELTRDEVLRLLGVEGQNLSKSEFVKRVYKYVQDNTRYVSISVDDGGFKPMKTKDVHDLGYGDCKALSYYTQSLLSSLDIPSYFTLLFSSRSSNVSLDTSFCSGIQANHAILFVPMEQDTFWLECTSDNASYKSVTPSMADRYVLAIKEQGGELIKTPAMTIGQNYVEAYGKVKIYEKDSSEVKLTVTSKGRNYYSEVGLKDLTKKEREDHLRSDELYYFKGIGQLVSKYDFVQDSVFALQEHSFNCKNILESLGDYLLIPIKSFILEIPKLKRNKNRKQEICFPQPKRVSSLFEYIIPKTFEIHDLPEAVHESGEVFEYDLKFTYSDEEHTITVQREFRIKSGVYPAEMYKQLRKSLNKIIKKEKGAITLKKKKDE